MSGAAPSACATAVEARGICRRFGHVHVLAGIDLDLAAGQTLAVFGPNGAGKTTLLRILAQVLRPSAGTVKVFGHDPAREPETVLASLGFLSHEVSLYLDLTPAENLVFTARLHGLEDPRGRAREALATVGLAGREVPVRALSRGLQQRTALARALLHRPALLLLDEPWTGLDPSAQRVLEARIADHRGRGLSAVFTTHDLGRGHATADRAVVLAGGKLRLDVRTADLTAAALEAEYRRASEAPA